MLVEKIKEVRSQSIQMIEDDRIQIKVDEFDFQEFNQINDHIDSIIN